MSYYQNASKIIYRRYRVLRKIIQTFEYTNSNAFSTNMLMLVRAVYVDMNILYGDYLCLSYLNNYYRDKCLEMIYNRNDIECIIRRVKNDK